MLINLRLAKKELVFGDKNKIILIFDKRINTTLIKLNINQASMKLHYSTHIMSIKNKKKKLNCMQNSFKYAEKVKF
ncbi:hypothetical protein BpHYR1_037568 [Brachionus plicatilis]|uniref:Uncharacterized protein n=1 Tax=Brachionus plicatilis TaxID=10195 RepID=A0A3M7RAM2_BRAPC|nr:hypothetical protein BpHYR1_037568 [Brachionus plicatilis]